MRNSGYPASSLAAPYAFPPLKNAWIDLFRAMPLKAATAIATVVAHRPNTPDKHKVTATDQKLGYSAYLHYNPLREINCYAPRPYSRPPDQTPVQILVYIDIAQKSSHAC